MSTYDRREEAHECPLCKGVTVPASLTPVCKCLLNAFNEWYKWGEEVRKALDDQKKAIDQLLAQHPEIEPPAGGGDVVDPPPKPPFNP